MDLLLVEDSPTDRLLMHNRLHRAFPKAHIVVADDAHQLADVLRNENCDVVVTDYWLGWSDGLSVLQRVKERWPRSRVIILTGNGGEEVVAEAFKFGLYHYLLKPDGFDNLVPIVRAAYESKVREDRSELMVALVSCLADAVYTCDLHGIVMTWNPAAERLYGFAQEAIVGHTMEILVPPTVRNEMLKLHEAARGGEQIQPFETMAMKADGSITNVAMTILPVRSGADLIGLACISAPATDSASPRSSAHDVIDLASRARRKSGAAAGTVA
jgi:PAS domain S-box-containing protein